MTRSIMSVELGSAFKAGEEKVTLTKLDRVDKRQCEIKDIKLCEVRTKIIALGWY